MSDPTKPTGEEQLLGSSDLQDKNQKLADIFKQNATKAKVVIVDDSSFARKTISQILTSAKITVAGEAKNAQEALALVKSTKANIALIDVVMPEVSGIELTRHLIDNFGGLHVIMMSSLAHDQIVIEAISAGALDFIRKPFKREQIIDSVTKIASMIKDIG